MSDLRERLEALERSVAELEINMQEVDYDNARISGDVAELNESTEEVSEITRALDAQVTSHLENVRRLLGPLLAPSSSDAQEGEQ